MVDPSLTISPLPESDGAARRAALEEFVHLERLVAVDLYGHDDLVYSTTEREVDLARRDYADRRVLVARSSGRVVGGAVVTLPLRSNTHLCEFDLVVHPGARRRGVGSALLGQVTALAREHGRTTLIGYAAHPADPERAADGEPAAGAGARGMLTAPTGAGLVPADAPATCFARAHRMALAQAERHSTARVEPDPAPVERLARRAAERAGADYRTVTWWGACPEEWREDLAAMRTRMSTDAPTGEADYREDPWDAARVVLDDEQVAAQGRERLTTAALHLPSGHLAAFTVLEVPAHAREFCFQQDTLVLAEHRGRSLGMGVKATNHRELTARRPGIRRIHTWNAAENSYMLAINQALGFHPAGVEALWQRRLDLDGGGRACGGGG